MQPYKAHYHTHSLSLHIFTWSSRSEGTLEHCVRLRHCVYMTVSLCLSPCSSRSQTHGNYLCRTRSTFSVYLPYSHPLRLWCWDWESVLLEREYGSDAIVWWIIARANWCFNPWQYRHSDGSLLPVRERERKHRDRRGLRQRYTFTLGRHMSISRSFLRWTMAISASLQCMQSKGSLFVFLIMDCINVLETDRQAGWPQNCKGRRHSIECCSMYCNTANRVTVWLTRVWSGRVECHCGGCVSFQNVQYKYFDKRIV